MAIYIIRFFSWGTWSILFSFFAVWLASGTGFASVDISLIAGTLALTNRAGALLFVRWVGGLGFKPVMLATQGLVALALACMHGLYSLGIYTLGLWLACAAVFGMASAVATLAQLTYIASGQTRADTLAAFSLENVALNLSAGITPYVSALVLNHASPHYLLFPLAYCLPTVLLCLWLQPARAQTRAQPMAPLRAFQGVKGRPGLGPFLALNGLTFFAFSLFYNVFPLHAQPLLGAQGVGLLFAASSLLIVLLQVPLTRLSRGSTRQRLLLAANGCLAWGVLALYGAKAQLGLAATAIVFLTVGEMIFGPVYQTMAVTLFPGRPAAAMALVTFVWAGAETSATVIGLYLVSQGQALPVFAFGAGCALVACLLLAWRTRTGQWHTLLGTPG
ncbi:MFS transporter [Pseudomonas typographi]|uniref:MFS transporter n=1 Tax=Pseudomonas typographi TaxID=2715964 RepID=UPI001681CE36|nr:MFS transporter [Pseudomonas typographi]MBD1553559.1 MFS transporter [Pseudomonas typographi]